MKRFLKAKIALAALAGSVLSFAAPDAEASIAKVTDRYVQINGLKYWRAGAETAGLGCIGWKRAGATGPGGSFKKSDCITLPLHIAAETEVTYSSGDNTSFLVGASHNSVAAGAAVSSFQSRKLKLRKLCVNEGSLRSYLGKYYLKYLRDLDKAGGTLPVATILCAWVLVDGEESQSLSAGGYATAKWTGSSFTLKGSSSSSSSVQFSPGSIVAYEQGIIKWTAGKTAIKRIEDDFVGAY
jgi:hypothetical protein